MPTLFRKIRKKLAAESVQVELNQSIPFCCSHCLTLSCSESGQWLSYATPDRYSILTITTWDSDTLKVHL